MTSQAEFVRGLAQLRVVVGPMRVVAGGAGHPVTVHHALHEIVALHPVLVRRAICKVKEVSLSKRDVFELPVVGQVQTGAIAHRPVVGFAVDKAGARAPLRVTLDAGIV